MAVEYPQIGDVLAGKHRIERILGEGGFGMVYGAVTEHSNRPVAIKVLKPTYDPTHAKRFMRELRAIAQLQSPHTLTLFDYGETEHGMPFMVTELIEGEDLSDLLERRGVLSEAETVHVLMQTLDSLREAHGFGLLHRDIKPQNIRLFAYQNDPLRTKVLDFGLAKSMVEDASAITVEGRVIGTPRYMSPEQLRGQQLTPAVDIYALGLVAVEMLLGRNATHSRSHRLGQGVQLGPEDNVRPAVRNVVNRMLAQSVENRFATASEVIAALQPLARAHRKSGPRLAPATPPPESVAEPRVDVPPTTEPEAFTPPPELAADTKRYRRAALVGVGFAVVAVVFVWGAARPGEPPPPRVVPEVSGAVLATAAPAAETPSGKEEAELDETFRNARIALRQGRPLDALIGFRAIEEAPGGAQANILARNKSVDAAIDALLAAPTGPVALTQLERASALFPEDDPRRARFTPVLGVMGATVGGGMYARDVILRVRAQMPQESAPTERPAAAARRGPVIVGIVDDLPSQTKQRTPSAAVEETSAVEQAKLLKIRTKAHVDRQIAASDDSVQKCGMSDDSPVHVEFDVLPDGETRDVKVMTDQVGGTRASDCLGRFFRGSKFHAIDPSGNVLHYKRTFKF